MVPLESPSQAAEVTGVLSGPTSPVVDVLEAVARETRLTELPPADMSEGLAEDLAAKVRGPAGQVAQAILEGGGEDAEPPGTYVEERFERLHRLVVAEEGQPSELDVFVEGPLHELHRALSNVAAGLGAGEGEALARFRQQAEMLPDPLGRWAAQVAEGSSGIAAGSTRAGLNARWQSAVLPLCERATAGIYPFDRRATTEIGLQDFTTLFAPGGLIDAFFQENLAEHVDTRTRPWSLREGGADLGISSAVLEQMHLATQIRDAFFAGGAEPSVAFQVTPEALDPAAAGVTLEVDGTLVDYQHGEGARPRAVVWPGPVGLARVAFAPPKPGSEDALVREGAWSWFRLLDAAELRATTAADRTRIIFNVGGRVAIFRMQTSSVANPFALGALSEFDCPESF